LTDISDEARQIEASTEIEQRAIARADAVILSTCVQMPSLESIATVESELNRPVLTGSSATTWKILDVLGLRGDIDGAGTLLSG
jgi:maleate isomerase